MCNVIVSTKEWIHDRFYVDICFTQSHTQRNATKYRHIIYPVPTQREVLMRCDDGELISSLLSLPIITDLEIICDRNTEDGRVDSHHHHPRNHRRRCFHRVCHLPQKM